VGRVSLCLVERYSEYIYTSMEPNQQIYNYKDKSLQYENNNDIAEKENILDVTCASFRVISRD
jgi:hypothetical protein